MKLHLTILFILLPLGLFAQTGGMDAAIDRYESITVQCIRMKQSVAAGEKVSRSELSALIKDLNGLRAELQGSSAGMTAAQRRRVAEIRKMYSDGRIRSTKMYVSPRLSPSGLKLPDSPAFLALPDKPLLLPSSPILALPEKASSVKSLLLAETGVVPDFTAGIRVGLLFGRFGFYLSGRSNFKQDVFEYECFSNGVIPEGGYIWTSGQSRVSRMNLSAGCLFCISNWAIIYAGAGYVRRYLFWQDVDHAWARVSDISKSAVAVDAGFIFSPFGKGPVLSIGSSYPSPELSVGLGWLF